MHKRLSQCTVLSACHGILKHSQVPCPERVGGALSGAGGHNAPALEIPHEPRRRNFKIRLGSDPQNPGATVHSLANEIHMVEGSTQ